jgi:mono/diheme cytochrome c family protein
MNQSVKRLVTSGLVLLLLAPLLVELTVTRAKPPQRRRSTARSLGAQQVGDLFRSNCARCHGADGRGDTPLGHKYKAPDFTDPEWWQKHSNITGTTSLRSIVARGKGGMPAFGKKLTRSEINLLVSYVRRFRNRSGAVVSQ